ncbi:GNAT family N-acetyltransferase [Lactiplantibacillus herbarum]|uniref:GNAT family N-acetyltransferase n=1 Tax=Lactiplantibacillus herbarum TaxID=1670446 RepID=UPI000AE64DC4|nr:GNAT family N-acetyltransferase [Lactiplantibacillus herbarum]
MVMVTVTVQGEQLELRPFTDADVTDYYELVCDPAVAAPAGFTPAHSLTEAEFLLRQQSKLPQIFAIELVAEHKVIGSIGLYERITNAGEPATQEMDLGYMLNGRYWRRGIMTAAFVNYNNMVLKRCNCDG